MAQRYAVFVPPVLHRSDYLLPVRGNERVREGFAIVLLDIVYQALRVPASSGELE